MKILHYFKQISSLSAEEVRKLIKEKQPDEFNLIDVRQPKEYEKAHIPGAQLIPVGQIGQRIHEIEKAKPTFVY